MRFHEWRAKKLVYFGIIAAAVVLIALAVGGCTGPSSPAGAAKPSAQATTPAPAAPAAQQASGTLSGKITNSITGAAVGGVKVAIDPPVQGVNISTDASGAFSATLPVGVYTLNISRDSFTASKDSVSLIAGQTATKNVTLKPVSPVAVKAGTPQTAAPGATVTLKATVEALDGSAVSGYQWTQVSGTPANLTNAMSETATAVLGKAADYKAKLIKGIETEDRFKVMPVIPHALVDAEQSVFKVEVTTSSGKYSGTVAVTAELPYLFSAGIQNVPQGVPVILNGKKQSSYGWTIAVPAGSKAELDEPGGQNPAFTPDVVGKYVITEKSSGATIDVYAGTWSGAISGIDAKGQPLSAACTTCHNGTTAADNFKDWKQSGHAQIFTQNINDPAGHWAITCADCHTVGYGTNVNNGGFDEAVTEENWKVPPHGEVGLWNTIVEKFPKTAKLANIQCENCHGPNNGSTLHANGKIDAARVSISSDVCGSCHGEPPRHGRFQQWEESGHANFELAIDDATVDTRGATAGHCGRCHTAQGFLTWIQQGDLTKQIQGKNGNATVDELKALGLTKDSVQPQTCVVCHDPHAEGALSGEPNSATVRISGNTALLPAGFKAENVGRGAICMTCHNTRNGLHNDSIQPANYSAPHVAAQTDVIMGENAYFVGTGERSPHASVKDTCTTCHMEATKPPAEFSFQGAGTNHSFAASTTICGTCHTASFDGAAFQTSYENKLEELGAQMGKYMYNKLPANVTIMDYTPHTNAGNSYDLKSVALTVNKNDIASVLPQEVHGQQAFAFKFKNSATFTYKTPAGETHTQSVTEAQVQLADITTDGKTPVIAPTDALVKAGWNYYLIHGDSSKGVHNPAFIKDVLEASEKALK